MTNAKSYNLQDWVIEIPHPEFLKSLDGHENKKSSHLTKWHYDLVVERGVFILDNRFPDDFGVPFFEYQEALGHCPGWKYDLDLLERRRHYFYG
jgi:hypothetical protein